MTFRLSAPSHYRNLYRNLLPPPNGEGRVFISDRLSVPLPVCLLATSRKNERTNFCEVFRIGPACKKNFLEHFGVDCFRPGFTVSHSSNYARRRSGRIECSLLSIKPYETHFLENCIWKSYSLKKMYSKMFSATWRPLCLGFNALTIYTL